MMAQPIATSSIDEQNVILVIGLVLLFALAVQVWRCARHLAAIAEALRDRPGADRSECVMPPRESKE
jgi:hypothetical protein